MKSQATAKPLAQVAWTHRKWAAVVCVLIALSLLAGLGMRAPSPPDEPRFVLAAKAMVESGEWLIPRRGVEIYAEKPPVFMWLQAISYTLTGSWNVAFLLPSLFAAWLTLWMTYRIGRMLWTPRIGCYAAAAMFATLQFGLLAKRAQIDMVLVALTTASMWGLLKHLHQGPNRAALFWGAAAAGLGTVTKGVGFLPLLVLFPWTALRFRGYLPQIAGGAAQWLLIPAGFAAGLAVWLLPLGLAVVQPHGAELDAYVREILFRQTATRYVGAWHHIQPAWYYLQVMLTLWLPGSLLLPRLLPAWQRRLARGDARYALLLGWVALTLAFFSASPGKREVYIFPALPLACIAAAPLLPGLLRQRYARSVLVGFTFSLGLASLVLAFSILTHLSWIESKLIGRGMDGGAVETIGWWSAALGVVLLVLASWLCPWRPGLLAVLTMACVWTVYGLGFMPALDHSASGKRVMEQVFRKIGPYGELGLVDFKEQNYLHSQGRATDFGYRQPWDVQWHRARAWAGVNPHRWILVTDKAVGRCVDRRYAVTMGQANRNIWVLVPSSGLITPCEDKISWIQADE